MSSGIFWFDVTLCTIWFEVPVVLTWSFKEASLCLGESIIPICPGAAEEKAAGDGIKFCHPNLCVAKELF